MKHSSDEAQLAAECYALAYERKDQATMQSIFMRSTYLPDLARYIEAIHRGSLTHKNHTRETLYKAIWMGLSGEGSAEGGMHP